MKKICEDCLKLTDWKWGKGRRDFVNKVQAENSALWERSTKHAKIITRGE